MLVLSLVLFPIQVPIIRNPAGTLLATPATAAMLTCAAPNHGVARDKGVAVDTIHAALAARIDLVLQTAVLHDQRTLVLGAFGCGVFRNPVANVAGLFAAALAGDYAGVFDRVVFAILDDAESETVRAFLHHLEPLGASLR